MNFHPFSAAFVLMVVCPSGDNSDDSPDLTPSAGGSDVGCFTPSATLSTKYPSPGAVRIYDFLREPFGKKVFSSDMWPWFMPWYGDYTRGGTNNSAQDFRAIFGDERVLTRGRMSDLHAE